MKVEKIPVKYEEIYIAEDGTRWDTATQCKEYEQLLKDPSPLKTLKFFDSEGNPLDVFALGEIPDFCYLIVEQDKMENYDWLVVKTIIGDRFHREATYNLPTDKGIYCNDWTNAYNGGYGYNGWKEQKSIEYLEATIKSCQNQIAFLKKITGSIEK